MNKDNTIRERCVERGIPLDMPAPIMPPRPPQPPKEIWYDMSWPWRIIVTEEVANKIAEFCKSLSGVEYATHGSYDGPKSLETGDLKPIKMSKTEVEIYTSADARAIALHSQKYREAERQFKLDKEAYDEWLSQINEIESEIDAERWARKEQIRRLDSLRFQWNEYMNMANQDSDIAKAFFIKTHGEVAFTEVLNYISNEETDNA